MEYTQLGQRIRTARKNKGYSQDELARKLGVQAAAIKRWENEESHPRINRLNTLAGILDVPVFWLLAGAENVPEPTAEQTDYELMAKKVRQAEENLDNLTVLLSEIKALVKKN